MLQPPKATDATPVADAVSTDAPRDDAFPTHNVALRVPSHDSLMNAVFLLASGNAPHPTVLFLHGLPGNEQNLDLAQSLRRAGFNVLTVHYRGSWGSAGRFSLANAEEDGRSARVFLQDTANVALYHIDPKRLIVVGHSMGGFVATRVAAASPAVKAVVLIAPWDIGDDITTFSVPAADLAKAAAKNFDDVDGRLGAVTSLDLAREVVAPGHDWHMASSAAAIADRHILILNATHDDANDQGTQLLQALRDRHAAAVTTMTMDTDHAFSDHRIALQSAVVGWLRGLTF